jgi:hypothetical protein
MSCSSSSGYESRREQCASTCPSGQRVAHVAISAGRRFLKTTPRPLSRVTSSWPSRRHFACSIVFVVIHHSSRRLVHFNVTEHPTSAWTLQQLREAVGYEACYRYLIHDRDSIFAKSLDESIARLGMRVLKSPFQNPTAPDPPVTPRVVQHQKSRHRLGEGLVVHAESVLGGLHHEYSFVAAVA